MSDTPRVDEIGVIIGRTKGFLLTDRTAHEAVDAPADVARDVIGNAEGGGSPRTRRSCAVVPE